MSRRLTRSAVWRAGSPLGLGKRRMLMSRGWVGVIGDILVSSMPPSFAAPRGGTHCSSPCNGSNAWRLRGFATNRHE
jgi:hypothetical protein